VAAAGNRAAGEEAQGQADRLGNSGMASHISADYRRLQADAVRAGLSQTGPIGEGAEALSELLPQGSPISTECLDVNHW